MGLNSAASGQSAIAIGSGSMATGDSAVAVGVGADAGERGTAAGLSASASGSQSVALGFLADASAQDSSAIGTGSTAAFAGSTAVGANAETTRANEVALGSAGSSVRVGDIAASTAAQVGPVDVVTVDANGTLGRQQAASAQSVADTRVAMSHLAAISEAQFGALEDRLGDLSFRLDDVDRATRGGIAAAMAMGGMMVVPDSTVSINMNLATYRGEQGFAGGVVARVAPRVYVSGAVTGSTQKKSTGGRVGVAFGL